ncbi:MAG: PadR family transcriptional regulator [Candidatus Thorarchaeota archaeon]
MRKPELRKNLLRIINVEKIHGYDIHKRLSAEGVRIGLTRMYSVLDEMVKDGLLTECWQKSRQGPKKKVFSLSESGDLERMTLLIDSVNSVHEFYLGYLQTFPPERNIFDLVWASLASDIRESPTIAIAVGHLSQPVDYLLNRFHNHFSSGSFYILTNPNVEVKDGNWQVLYGIYDDVPLKNEYLDMLVVLGFHLSYSDPAIVREWHRMIRKDGKLVVVTASIQTAELDEPLPMGQYIEFHQHSNHGVKEDWDVFKTHLCSHFNCFEENVIGDIAILEAKSE